MGKRTKRKQGSAQTGRSRFNSTTLLLLGGIVLISAAIVVFIWFLLTPNRTAGGAPQMQLSAERVDLGKQAFNTPVRASFTVKNVGTGTLTLNVPRSTTLLEGC